MSDELALITFYRGTGFDAAGRSINEIWSWDHRRLEMVHDYIQWLFPLPEPSRFNPAAPLLTPRDIACFRSDATLQENVRRSLDLMLDFFALGRAGGAVARRGDFAAAARWLTAANHNHLRLTRILLFLRHAGLEAEAGALFSCLADIAKHEGKAAISPRTLSFWRDAMQGAL